ncbi:MAG: hypothetical protein VKQ33_07380 [Candidatus Sericytochromatia bacterium]|nr:hypothetical protein [Candidatus Sericytochromatia bacterium]
MELARINGWRGIAYYVLFPLDLFGEVPDSRLAYQQAKLEELLPILGILCPLFVLGLASTSVGWGGLLLTTSLVALMLAALSKVHLRLAPNQLIEIWLNLWLSMVILSVVLALLGLLVGGLSQPSFNWD